VDVLTWKLLPGRYCLESLNFKALHGRSYLEGITWKVLGECSYLEGIGWKVLNGRSMFHADRHEEVNRSLFAILRKRLNGKPYVEIFIPIILSVTGYQGLNRLPDFHKFWDRNSYTK